MHIVMTHPKVMGIIRVECLPDCSYIALTDSAPLVSGLFFGYSEEEFRQHVYYAIGSYLS
jgi:hypothetical protein